MLMVQVTDNKRSRRGANANKTTATTSSGGRASADAAAAQAEKKPSAEIAAAFGLGWHIAELKYLEPDKESATTVQSSATALPMELFPLVTDFDFDARTTLLLRQTDTDLKAINKSLAGDANEVELPSELPLNLALTGQKPLTVEDLKNVPTAQKVLLENLFAADYRLGKAYSIGATLGQIALRGKQLLLKEPAPEKETRPADKKDDASAAPPQNELMVLFGDDRVSTIVSQLKDLKTEFEDHASDSVSATLQDWSDTVGTWSRLSGEARKTAADSLDQQGTAWRALLSGEKEATDYLHLTDYAKAIRDLLGQYAALARSAGLNQTTLVILGVMVVLVGGGAAWLYTMSSQQVNAIYAALIGLLAAFGITGASIMASIRSALSTAENMLWETELSAATAEAIDKVPVRNSRSNVAKLRREPPRPTISVLKPSDGQDVHEQPIKLGKWFGLSLVGGTAAILAFAALQVQGGVTLIDAASVAASAIACYAVSLLAFIAFVNFLAWIRDRPFVWLLPPDIPRFRTDWLVPFAVAVGVVAGKLVWQ
jgi:hypothetical protein